MESTARERVEIELQELTARYEGLSKFVGTAKFYELPHNQQVLLSRQFGEMGAYKKTLIERLEIWDK